MLDLGDLGTLDLIVLDYMTTNQVPNGAVAVVSGDGRLVYCKAFTWCKLLEDHGEEVFRAGVHSRFRVASVSKAITAVATMVAVEQGYFGSAGIHAKAADYVDFADQWWGSTAVVRGLWDIEIVHLLTHSAGWDEYGAELEKTRVYPRQEDDVLRSPTYFFEQNDLNLAASFRTCLPTEPKLIWWDQNTTALSGWGVGNAWSYSNHGFVVLGRVLAAATGMAEADWVRRAVWDPLGATDSAPGKTLLADRAVGEVKYYDRFWPDYSPSYGYSSSVMTAVCGSDGILSRVLDYHPYAYFNLENALGGGGWTSSVYDLALLMRDLFRARDGFGRPASALLSSASIAAMRAAYLERDQGVWQGLGWELNIRSASAPDLRKTGHLDGTNALLYNFGPTVRTTKWGDASLIYVFNRFWRDQRSGVVRGLPADAPESSGDLPYLEDTLQQNLWSRIEAVEDWGGGDLVGSL